MKILVSLIAFAISCFINILILNQLKPFLIIIHHYLLIN